MMRIARRFLAVVTVLLAAALGLVAMTQVVLCGNVHAICPGTPMWHLEAWVAGHQGFALTLSVAYAATVFALFRKQMPGALEASVRPGFAFRATAYIAAVALVLILAMSFPALTSFF